MRRRTVLLVWLFATAGAAAQAKVVYVNRDAAGAVHDGASWSTAFMSVKAGVTAAVGGDEVWVARGTYTENDIRSAAGVALYGGFAGTETARGQRDRRANVTNLDGGGSYSPMLVCDVGGITVDGFSIHNLENEAVLVNTDGAITLTNNIISRTGSAVTSYGTAILSNNVISRGAGVACLSGTVTLTNNTLSGNTGGVFVVSGTATLTSNSITGSGGVGVYVENGAASLTNNIIAFNGTHGLLSVDSTITAFSHNDVYGNASGDISGFTPPAGQGNLSVDPKLSSIYHDVHLQPGSPLIDAGDDASATGTTDVDGQPRVQGARVDIGSDESDGTLWSVPPQTWFVSPNGDDASDGRSWATAKKTVNAAVSRAQGPGEVWVAKGTYNEVYIRPAAGVALFGGFAGTETGRGQRNWRTNITTLVGSGTFRMVVECRFQNNVVDGFTIRGDRFGAYLGQGTATLANCIVTGNETGVVVETDATLSNNVIHGNALQGVYVAFGTAVLVNNTVAGNPEEGVRVDNGGTALMTNNIIAFNGLHGIANFATISTFSHNNLYGNTPSDTWQFTPPAGQGNISADPQFVDLANGNFRLQAGSPGIDAGVDAGIHPGSTDLDGKPRIIGARVDMGAYEYGTPTAPFTLADVTKCLSIACGLSAGTPDDLARLNVEAAHPALDLLDGLRLARKVAGLDGNP